MHTAKCLKTKNSYCIFFIHQKKNVLACILALITSLLKSREHWPKFQKKKQKNFILFISEHPGYDITRNAYSGYLIRFLFGQ